MVSCSSGRNKPADYKEYGIEVVREYPHDRSAYTQGLFFHENRLYETTGEYGKSTFRRYADLTTAKADTTFAFKDKYFVEGSVIFKDKLYVMTWTNGVVFVYDAATLDFIKGIGYPRQGWGMTTDGKCLYATDGSSRLYCLDEDLNVTRSMVVKRKGYPVSYLNELEFIDGKVWANVYTTDEIVVINPETGVVEASIDCTGLLNDMLRAPDTDVLNGIAYNPADKKIYLTGKNWPLLFEVRLVEKQ